MSKIYENKFHIKREMSELCEYCGKLAELRPYGKNKAKICFSCGMKNEKETEKQYNKVLNEIDTITVDKNLFD